MAEPDDRLAAGVGSFFRLEPYEFVQALWLVLFNDKVCSNAYLKAFGGNARADVQVGGGFFYKRGSPVCVYH